MLPTATARALAAAAGAALPPHLRLQRLAVLARLDLFLFHPLVMLMILTQHLAMLC
jgi:hypothetical protein